MGQAFSMVQSQGCLCLNRCETGYFIYDTICNNYCIIQEDEKFLSEVFAQLTDDATDDDKRRELVSLGWLGGSFKVSAASLLVLCYCFCSFLSNLC